MILSIFGLAGKEQQYRPNDTPARTGNPLTDGGSHDLTKLIDLKPCNIFRESKGGGIVCLPANYGAMKSTINGPISEEKGNPDQQVIQEEKLQQEPFWRFSCRPEKLLREIQTKTFPTSKQCRRDGSDINLIMYFNAPRSSACVIVTASGMEKGCSATVQICGDMSMVEICRHDMDMLMDYLQRSYSDEASENS